MNTIVITVTLHDVPEDIREANNLAFRLEESIQNICDAITDQQATNGPHAQVYAGVRV